MPPKRTPGTKKSLQKQNESVGSELMKPLKRPDKQRVLQSASRNRLSGSEKDAQLKTHRDDLSRYIHNLTDELTDERLDRQRECQLSYIYSQTNEQTAERVDKQREYQ